DVDAFILEDRTLFDMKFKEGLHRPVADFLLALPADALEFVTEALALGVDTVVGPLQFVDACKYTGGEHRRGEARAFFVGPVGYYDRVLRPDAEIVQRTDDFEAAKNAQHAVILAARRLRIEM